MFKTKGIDPITLLLILIIGIAAFMSGFFSPRITKSPPKDEGLIVLEKKNYSSEKGLQIDTFLFGTPSPTQPPPPPSPPPPPQIPLPQAPPPPPPPPGNYCQKDALKTPDCQCEPGQSPRRRLNCNNPDACDPYGWSKINKTPPPNSCSYIENKDSADGFNFYYKYSGCSEDLQLYCASKPVIYLYPTKKTIVDVRLDIPGEVVVSDPLYPAGGWKNVEAHPDGTLYYKEKKYRELYYESTFENLTIPKNGIIIPKEKLKEELKSATTKLGLNDFEQKEFLDYWVPRLSELNSPYILFSLLDKEEKERVDHVVISPEPQTRIEFMAYFKPLTLSEVEGPIPLTPLILPNDPPKRIGFTEVEWGGILEKK